MHVHRNALAMPNQIQRILGESGSRKGEFRGEEDTSGNDDVLSSFTFHSYSELRK